jgi:hypothetical protein
MPLTFVQIYLAQKQYSKAITLSEVLVEDLMVKLSGTDAHHDTQGGQRFSGTC